MAGLSKPREAALKALVATFKDGAYLNIALRSILAEVEDPRDCALATTLAFGVTKNLLYIDNIIANLSTVKLRKLSVWIHNILRIGVYSIKFLDRIPESATVNECVKLSRRYGHGASAGFVNAVLRKVSSSPDFLPDKKIAVKYLSVKYSFPEWMVRHFLEQGYGEELLSALNSAPQVIVRLNTVKGELPGDDFIKLASEKLAYVYKGIGSGENTREFKEGCVTVQDIASQRAVEALKLKKSHRALDLCAAPGGKTTYMAALCSEVVSCDIHSHKLALIEANLKRLGITNAKVMQNDAAVLNESFKDSFDAVLADVPCSGLGILRRKPDIKWKKTEDELKSLTKVQYQILKTSAAYVKKGGRLVYSTCTINTEENEKNIEKFLKEHADFKIDGDFAPFGKQLLPNADNSDGFFIAPLERK